MAIMGKALGAGLGFFLGGPIGAILGGVLGHAWDADNSRNRYRQENDVWPEVEDTFDRQVLFYTGLASLAAKMAKADGRVTRDEIEAFDSFLSFDLGLSAEERRNVARIFNEAKNSPEEAAAIALQFKQLIGYQHEVLDMMLELLFKIALADGELHPNEENFLRQVATVFGFNRMQFENIRALYVREDDRPYKVLGVERGASAEEIRQAYHKLVREYHPDRLQAKGVPEDFLKIANEKMAEINSAYDQIKRERNF